MTLEEVDWASECLAEIKKTLETCGCCHGHDGSSTPPMMYPEWIACCVSHRVLTERKRAAGLVKAAGDLWPFAWKSNRQLEADIMSGKEAA